MIKHLCEQRSEAWHELRIGCVTGTAIADLMSKKDTLGYKKLINRIAAELITNSEADEETYTNEAMQRGIDLEPEARKEYERLFDCEVEQVGFITPDEETEFAEWLGISPDGLIENGVVEFKCPERNTHIEYIKANKLPSKYKWQVQGGLLVSGGQFCDFMSFYPQMKSFIIRVLPDLEMHEKIKVELRKAIKLVNETIDNYNKYDYLTK